MEFTLVYRHLNISLYLFLSLVSAFYYLLYRITKAQSEHKAYSLRSAVNHLLGKLSLNNRFLSRRDYISVARGF